MRCAWLLLVLSAGALAQENEFELPTFGRPDAGVSVAEDAHSLPPPPTVWQPFGGTLMASFNAFQNYEFAVDASLYGLAHGLPHASDEAPGEVEGWVVQVGANGSFGRVGGAICDGVGLCGTRVTGGASSRVGFARGVPGVRDGKTRFQTMYFGQLDVLLGRFGIESAPLAPGFGTWEFITRLRAGVQISSESARTSPVTAIFIFAVNVQTIIVGDGTRGVLIGGSAGLAL